ncbi:Sulfite exporter TauE/SafE family protein [Rickettsiales endosymbiont of Paramecium tredecaurelia]|nr:Sulfite exporter TauE/SafE family protein [Candidatus Sarmatiella mevalonica]
MGITLGLVGAGGSILTIPILVYLLQVPITLATSYSLVVVGSTAFIGLLRYRDHILFRKAILFLIPSALGVFAARRFIVPTLSNILGHLLLGQVLVILLIIFMGIAGYFMIKRPILDIQNHSHKKQNIKKSKVVLIGLALGIIMGLLGAGGGFLIIPTLVLLMHFAMREAVATSLFIIAINSFIGFVTNQSQFIASDWGNLKKYLTPSLLGMLIGLYIVKFINGEILKKSFGYFIWVVGIAILTKEFIL